MRDPLDAATARRFGPASAEPLVYSIRVHRLRACLTPSTAIGRMRLVVFGVALVTTGLKLLVAANTYGTNDVRYWTEFAAGVRSFGPVGIYGQEFRALYNHPPLSGWLLVCVNWLVDRGVAGLPFLIRVPASLADLLTSVLVFELVRLRRSARAAGLAALAVAVSPVLFVVSGFHGNTDPVFVMFALLSVYLLAVRGWAAAAGLCFAASVSVKLVPIVLGPVLLLAAARMGWRRLVAFCLGGAALFLPVWGPVLLTRWPEFRENVLGYQGIRVREWGLLPLAKRAGVPRDWIDALIGPGRFVVLLLAIGIPLERVRRRADALVPAVGLSLALFLLLSPAFGMQYLSWALAGTYLISGWAATGFNLAASGFIVIVYDYWNRAPPWDWYEARAMRFRDVDFTAMTVTWVALAVVVIVGLLPRTYSMLRAKREPASPGSSDVSRAPRATPRSSERR